MKAIKLSIYQFDSLENRNPIILEQEKIFIQSLRKTAHGMASIWIDSQKPVKLYLGYDGIVYPQYIIKEIDIN